jgi:hypothetical protein
MRKAERRNAKMINVERIEVFNWEGAIRGMRNPLNSWEKSDSNISEGKIDFASGSTLGKNDFSLMKRLVSAGSDERKFMRQILVSLDINAPFYFWKEFDTYKIGTTANSCSTMHTLHTRDLVIGDFSHEHFSAPEKQMLEAIVEMINFNRKLYIDTKDKEYWYRMIQLLPTSYNQTRTITLNYEVLRNMYHARKHHKLDEWRELCGVIEGLPYSELITMEAKVAK